MDLATIIGLAMAGLMVLGAIIIESGGDISAINSYVPTSGPIIAAYMLVVGGTLAATMVTAPLSGTIGLPKAILKTMMPGKHESPSELAMLFVRLSEKARREGLLSLEEEEHNIHSEFMKKGIIGVVD